MDILNEIKQTVKEELSLYEIQLLEALKSDSALLTSAVQYFLSKKGKNVRPLLVMLAAKSVLVLLNLRLLQVLFLLSYCTVQVLYMMM